MNEHLQENIAENENIDLERLQRIQEFVAENPQEHRTSIWTRQPGDDPQPFHEVRTGFGGSMLQEQALLPYPRDLYGNLTISERRAVVSYMEAVASRGMATTSNFPDLLRQGLMFDVMSSYAQYNPIYPALTGGEMPSSKQQEEYLTDAGMGIAQIVHEGQEYPEAAIDLESGVIIKNYKRGFKLPVTEEMRRFDQLGKVRDLAFQAGQSLAITEEYAVMEVLTTTAHYDSSSSENDEGDNTATATLCASAYETALNTLITMHDKNGNYLMVNPTVFFCSPKSLHYAKRLLMSPTLHRTHGATAAEVDGLGQNNPFYGQITMIISSPYIGSNYEWGLLDPSRSALKFQRVDAATVRGPEFKMDTDTYWFYPRTWFGVGFKDDRFAYFSDSTTRPTVS